MFRIIRRSPWIALGAAAAYYLDGENGPRRRRAVSGRARQWGEQLRAQSRGDAQLAGAGASSEPMTPSVSRERVESRAHEPLAEEQSAGVETPAPTGMAEQILAESEERVTDRAGTSREHRRSEETVAGAG